MTGTSQGDYLFEFYTEACRFIDAYKKDMTKLGIELIWYRHKDTNLYVRIVLRVYTKDRTYRSDKSKLYISYHVRPKHSTEPVDRWDNTEYEYQSASRDAYHLRAFLMAYMEDKMEIEVKQADREPPVHYDLNP